MRSLSPVETKGNQRASIGHTGEHNNDLVENSSELSEEQEILLGGITSVKKKRNTVGVDQKANNMFQDQNSRWSRDQSSIDAERYRGKDN